jgi:hypothetical protein
MKNFEDCAFTHLEVHSAHVESTLPSLNLPAMGVMLAVPSSASLWPKR